MTDRTMPPVGPAMDALVVAALGCRELHYAKPSRCIGDAVWAIEEWRKQHLEFAFTIDSPLRVGPWAVWLRADGRILLRAYAYAPTLEAAICQAIIRAQWALEDAR